MPPHTATASFMQYLIPIVVIGAIFILRIARMRGQRRLRLEMLWILPAIYGAGVIAMFVFVPPSPMGFLWAAIALAVGGAIGWYRGTMMKISVDPETHALSQQASPAAVILLFGLLILRRAAMFEFMGPGINAMLITDIAMAFALGLIAATRIEMTLRARRLLREARTTGLSRTFS